MNSARAKFDFPVPVERQELNVAVYNLKETIAKLSNLTEQIDAAVKRDTTPCDIIDLSWLFQEKCKMIDKIKEDLLNSETSVLGTKGEMLIDLYDTLVKENIQQEQALKQMMKESKSLEDNLAKTEEFLHHIELNQEAIATNKINTPKMLDVNLLDKKSAAKMREIRTKFHELLDICFTNLKTKQLIADLTNAYFKGGDTKYIDISDIDKDVISDTLKLKSSGLIVEDPYNSFRIKFDDII